MSFNIVLFLTYIHSSETFFLLFASEHNSNISITNEEDVKQQSLWANDKYDELTSTQSLIIINNETLQFVSLSRGVNVHVSDTEYGEICFQLSINYCALHF